MSSVEAQGRYQWLWNRLLCMTPGEVVHRASEMGHKRLKRLLGQPQRKLQALDREPSAARWILPPEPRPEVGPYVAEAQRIAAGHVRLFGGESFEVGVEPIWNRCPLTGVTAPAVHSSRISLPDRTQVGDIKFVWELNRHLHWVVLAQAYALTGSTDHLEVLRRQVSSWLAQCPPDHGPNWTSSLEYALRLINWSVVWQLIGGESSPLFTGERGQALLRDWLNGIQHQVLAIAEHFSRYSSANNHLIGELAGVFVAAQTWPCWSQVRLLGLRAERELEQQILLQTTADGVNREQAFEYTTFAYDFFAVVERCSALHGKTRSTAYLDRMAAMCVFIRSVMAVGGAVPQVGDADGAQVLRLAPSSDHESYAAMLHKGAALFGRPDWVQDLGGRGEMDARWMYAAAGPARPSTDRQAGLEFPEGGYQLFAAHVGSSREIKGLLDVGPLGYLGIAAHGHADALQLCMSIGGQPLLVDSGTYSYWCEKPWRDYFRGTSAHNTVRVAELDQSVSGGRFMWTRKAQVRCLHVQRQLDGGFELTASHNGYQRLKSAFQHQRHVRFDPLHDALEVRDELNGRGAECLELFWHLHPAWSVNLKGDSAQLTCGELSLVLRVEASGLQFPGRLELISGQDEPPLAWYSEGYNVKRPTNTLRWQGHGERVSLLTHLSFEGV